MNNDNEQLFLPGIDHQQEEYFGIAYGLGVDSTAMIVGLVQRGIRPDYILFADVGAEKQATYDYLPIIQQYLKDHNFPPVTPVRYEPKTAPYTTIEGNMVMNATLPGATFNRGSCTDKFKIKPQVKWEKQNRPHGKIIKAIGFDAGEGHRLLKANDKAHIQKSERYEYKYFLIDWDWDREKCKAVIREAGLPVPPKSACIFCPNTKPDELLDMTSGELGRIVRVEVVAEPYNKDVHGLWRTPRKRDNRPGSITEYLVQKEIPFIHPDDLKWMPLNPNCLKGKRGFTFNGPHNELRLSALIGGCKCAKAENHFHRKLIEDMTTFELNAI